MGCGVSKPNEPIIDPKKEAEEQARREETERLKQKAEEAELRAKREQEEREKFEEKLRLKEEEEARRREEAEREAEEIRKKQEEIQDRMRAEEEARIRAEAEAAAEEELAHKDRCRVCSIVGPPGSIKGRLCELIVQREPAMRHTSAGEVMREAIRLATPAGLRAKAEREGGGQVSDDTTVDMVVEILLGAPGRPADPDRRWLLDGFPRHFDQASGMLKAGVMLGKLVYVQIDDAELVRRAVGRRIDPVEHTIYHLEGLGFPTPPDEPQVLARLTQRKDDSEERVRARLKQYYESNEDLSAEFFRAIRVDGTKDPEEVLEEVLAFLDA